MAYINLIELENADGILKAEYKKGIQRAGKIYNILMLSLFAILVIILL